MASTMRASLGSGIACFTRCMARSWIRPVSAPPRRSMTPPSGSGVLWPMPAARSAAVFATPMWPQVRVTKTGLSGAAASSSAAVGWRPMSSAPWS